MKAMLPAAVAAAIFFTSCAAAQAADPPAASPAPRSPAEREARAKLSGVWHGFTVMGKGETPDAGPVEIELTITTETIRGRQFRDGEVIDHGEGWYVLDLSKNPPVLDAAKLRGGRNVDEWLGIYRLEGDTLKWCVRKRERPDEFETKDKAFLLILKRRP